MSLGFLLYNAYIYTPLHIFYIRNSTKNTHIFFFLLQLIINEFNFRSSIVTYRCSLILSKLKK